MERIGGEAGYEVPAGSADVKRLAVGEAEAGVEDAGRCDDAEAGGDYFSACGLAAAEDLLGVLAVFEELNCLGDVLEEGRDWVSSAKNSCGQCGSGVCGAFEPYCVWVVGGSREAGS